MKTVVFSNNTKQKENIFLDETFTYRKSKHNALSIIFR